MYVAARTGFSLMGAGSGTYERVGVLFVVGGASLAAYLGTALLLRAEELRYAVALSWHRSATAE